MATHECLAGMRVISLEPAFGGGGYFGCPVFFATYDAVGALCVICPSPSTAMPGHPVPTDDGGWHTGRRHGMACGCGVT